MDDNTEETKVESPTLTMFEEINQAIMLMEQTHDPEIKVMIKSLITELIDARIRLAREDIAQFKLMHYSKL